MNLRKKGCLRRKINLAKAPGTIEWSAGLFFLLFLLVFLYAELQLTVYKTASMYLEDTLAASNLASAVIDIEEYGISHTVKIGNPLDAFERFRVAVKENLQLDDSWECANVALISGPVKIEKYMIYNVQDNKVEVISVAPDGSVSIGNGVLGITKAPNGILITNTSVYSEISFPVKGWKEEMIQAYKGKLVDIATNKEDEEIV